MAEICKFFMRKMPCMLQLVQSRWFPVPAEVVRSLQQQPEERISQTRTTARNNQRSGCCACCAPRAEG